jgi:hypothetical protein
VNPDQGRAQAHQHSFDGFRNQIAPIPVHCERQSRSTGRSRNCVYSSGGFGVVRGAAIEGIPVDDRRREDPDMKRGVY